MKITRKLRKKLLKKLVAKTRAQSDKALSEGRPEAVLRTIHAFSFWTRYRRQMRRFAVRQSMQVVRCAQSQDWQYHSLNPLLTDYGQMTRFLERMNSYAERFQTPYLQKLYFDHERGGPVQRPAHVPDDGPPRVLVLTGNMNFIDGPVAALKAGGAEVRVFDTSKLFKVLKARDEETRGQQFMSRAAFYGVGRYAHTPHAMRAAMVEFEPEMAEALTDWCDTAFCDWASHNAIWFSKCTPAGKRLVVRCHSYEAFSHFPVFMRHARIDQMIFIAPHIQDIYLSHPMDDPTISARSVFIQNLRPPEVPARPDAVDQRSFQLGMLGFGNRGKDPVFAIEVLKNLVATDKRWRLHLAGHDFGAPGVDEQANAYADMYRAAVAEMKDYIVYSGFISEKADWFAKIGFVLSTSQREGSHEAAVEGLAHGCIPALRDWPLVSRFQGASRSFPDFPSFDTPEALAAHIQSEQERFEPQSARAKQIAAKRYFSDDIGAAFFEAVTGQSMNVANLSKKKAV